MAGGKKHLETLHTLVSSSIEKTARVQRHRRCPQKETVLVANRMSRPSAPRAASEEARQRTKETPSTLPAPATPVVGRGGKVLVVHSYDGWVLHRNAKLLAAEIEKRGVGVDVVSTNKVPRDVSAYRAVVLVWWKAFEHLKGALPPIYTCVYDHYTWKGPKWGDLFLQALAASRAVFASNRMLVGEITEAASATSVPVLYMPDGVDTAQFSPAPQKAATAVFRLGWCGNSRAVKRLHFLREAVARVPGTCLVVADRGEPATYVQPEKMPGWYRGLDAIACVSSSEGTPNPILEGAACGLPFLSTPVGVVPELYKDGVDGVFTLGDSVEAVEGALRTLVACRSIGGKWASKNAEIMQSKWDWAGKFDSLLSRFL